LHKGKELHREEDVHREELKEELYEDGAGTAGGNLHGRASYMR
jgi:hypothetical protein